MNEVVLRTTSLCKKYGHFFAVDKANITINQGDIYGLVGKNGAGKTTLIRMITGLTVPTSGELELFGETTQSGLNEARMRTGCIVETPSFYPYLTAEKNLEYYRVQRGIPNKECIKEVLNIVGLENTAKKKFKNFSLGMKQRLGLALAIMVNPDLLILDEPINGLDPMGIVEFRDILHRLNREKNTTIVISSHILSELSQIATRYGFIDNGRFVEQISAKELEEKCKSGILMKVNNTEKACVILENNLKCTNYEVLNNNQIKLFELIDTPELVVEALVKNGVMLSQIGIVGANLESYFIDLVGGNENV